MIVTATRISIVKPVVDPDATPTAVDAAKVVELAPDLLATARFLVRSNHDARDLAQATIEIALRNLSTLRDPTKLRSWLLAIEAREASRLRRRLRETLSLDREVREIPNRGPHTPSIALKIAIGRLPRRQRTAVALHHLAGLSVEETARAMGVSHNTIKTHLRLAFAALREALR